MIVFAFVLVLGLVIVIAVGLFDPREGLAIDGTFFEDRFTLVKNSHSQVGQYEINDGHIAITLQVDQPTDGALLAKWEATGLQVAFYPSGFVEIRQGDVVLHPLQDFPHIQLVESGGLNRVDILVLDASPQLAEVWINREIVYVGCSGCMQGVMDLSVVSNEVLFEGIIRVNY